MFTLLREFELCQLGQNESLLAAINVEMRPNWFDPAGASRWPNSIVDYGMPMRGFAISPP